jgi:putative transposase
LPASQRNQAWVKDFVHYQLGMNEKIRVLMVVGIFSKLSPIIYPSFSNRTADMLIALERIRGEVGYPKATRVDQGS